MKRLLAVFLILPFISGCGEFSQRVKDLVINTLAIDNEMHLVGTTSLDLGGIVLPNINHEIIHPSLGKLGLLSIHGDNQVSFQLNISVLTPNLNVSDAILPNGKKVPLIGDLPTVVLPVKGTGASFYITLAKGAAVVGFALPFKNFGGELGEELGSFSVIPTFQVKDFKVAGGLFYSENPGESGLGAFIDISDLLDRAFPNTGVEPPVLVEDGDYELDYEQSVYSKDEQKASSNYLIDLNNEGRVLELY